MHKSKHDKGVVSIMTILLLAGILIEMSIAGLAISFLAGEKGLGMRNADTALFAARSGAYDAQIRIARNKSFVPDPNPYTIAVNGGSASVEITRTLSGASHIQYIIESTGTSGLKKIKITSTMIIEDRTGGVSGVSFVESGI